MRSFRPDDGQSTTEFIAIVAVVAVVLLTAGAVAASASPTLRNAVTTAFQRSLCTVAGQRCLSLEREPCPVLRTDDLQGQESKVGFIKMSHDRALLIERRSDGTYGLSLTEGMKYGGEASIGGSYGGHSTELSAQAMAGLRAGRTYVVKDADAARAMVEKLRGQHLPAARAMVAGAGDLLGLAEADPEVESYVLAGDGVGDALTKVNVLGLFNGGVDGSGELQLGARVAAHEREVTAYAQLDGKIGVFFDALVSATGKTRKGNDAGVVADTGVLEKPRAGFNGGGTVALRFGPGAELLAVEIAGRYGTETSAREIHARIDPKDPAVAAAIKAWRAGPLDPSTLAGIGLAARDSAALDVRSYDVSEKNSAYGGSVSLGLGFGLEATFSRKTSRLADQRSRPPGGVWEERLDCAA